MSSIKFAVLCALVAVLTFSQVEAGSDSIGNPCILSCPPGTTLSIARSCECVPIVCEPPPYGCPPYKKWDKEECKCVKM